MVIMFKKVHCPQPSRKQRSTHILDNFLYKQHPISSLPMDQYSQCNAQDLVKDLHMSSRLQIQQFFINPHTVLCKYHLIVNTGSVHL